MPSASAGLVQPKSAALGALRPNPALALDNLVQLFTALGYSSAVIGCTRLF